MATSTLGASTKGLPMGSSESVTEQFAVPPRISGPYEGSQDTSRPARRPAYATTLPANRTPWPPKPANTASIF